MGVCGGTGPDGVRVAPLIGFIVDVDFHSVLLGFVEVLVRYVVGLMWSQRPVLAVEGYGVIISWSRSCLLPIGHFTTNITLLSRKCTKVLFQRRGALNVLTDSSMLLLDLEWQDAFVTSEGLPHRLRLSLVATRIENLEHFFLRAHVVFKVTEAMQGHF